MRQLRPLVKVSLFWWGSLWAREHKQIQWVFMWTLAPLPSVTWSPEVTKKGGQLHSKAVLPAGVLIVTLALAHTTAAWELVSFFFWVVSRICSKNYQKFIWPNSQEDTTNSRILYFPSSGVNRKKFLITNSLLIKWILFTHQEFEATGTCLLWGKQSPNEINSNPNGISLIMWYYSYLLTESC